MTSARRKSVLSSLGLRDGRVIVQAMVASAFLGLAALLGGATAEGTLLHAFLQIIAILVLAILLLGTGLTNRSRPERQLLTLAALFAALFLVQLIPLPPALWRALPGRQIIADGFIALGVEMPWQPISLAPAETLQAAAALLPAFAMAAMIIAFERPVARIVAAVLAVLTVVSVLLGAAQVAGSASLYFYSITNGGSAVGFFANANHFGTLMCVTVPLGAALIARWGGGAAARQPGSRIFSIAAFVGLAVFGVIGIALSGSLAAVLLGVLGIAGGGAIVFSGLPRKLNLMIVAGAAVAALVALALVLLIAPDILGTGSQNGGELGRLDMWRHTISAMAQFPIVGSGFGSFQQVYHLVEDPNQVSATFANHAHNDLLEYFLEGGVAGVLVLLLFLLWFGKRLFTLWRGERDRDPLAQGASIAVLILLAHSLVDYPLRTGSLAVIMGFCCAVVARPARARPVVKATDEPIARHMAA